MTTEKLGGKISLQEMQQQILQNPPRSLWRKDLLRPFPLELEGDIEMSPEKVESLMRGMNALELLARDLGIKNLSAQLKRDPNSPLARAIRSIVSKTIGEMGFLGLSHFDEILKENFPDGVSEEEAMLLAGAYGIGLLAGLPQDIPIYEYELYFAERILGMAVRVIAPTKGKLPKDKALRREVLQKMSLYFENVREFRYNLLKKYGVGSRIRIIDEDSISMWDVEKLDRLSEEADALCSSYEIDPERELAELTFQLAPAVISEGLDATQVLWLRAALRKLQSFSSYNLEAEWNEERIASAISAGLRAGTSYLSRADNYRFTEYGPSVHYRYKGEEYFGCCWWAFNTMESKWSEVINNDKELVLYAAAFTLGLMASHMSYKKDRNYHISDACIAKMPFLLATARKAGLDKVDHKVDKEVFDLLYPFYEYLQELEKFYFPRWYRGDSPYMRDIKDAYECVKEMVRESR
uniref:Uncharacterized protein n=1 Tax=candidate division CPR3 bacterium TaxID=2268181 RepID=A0A7C5YYG3_UNCC3